MFMFQFPLTGSWTQQLLDTERGFVHLLSWNLRTASLCTATE